MGEIFYNENEIKSNAGRGLAYLDDTFADGLGAGGG